MAKIRPLRGIRYNSELFAPATLSQLVAPPYDVIDEEELRGYYARHRYNVVRMDLNIIRESDHAENNRYTRARRHLMDWLARGVLRVEDEPALYVHYQDFALVDGTRVTRRGFIGLVELAEYSEGVVLPHEFTLRGPKIDRLELMKATECNLSNVFLLYEDPQQQVDTLLASAIELDKPALSIDTEDGITHRLWVVKDEAIIGQVAELLRAQSLLIADGHHRYETALAYRDFRREVEEERVVDAPYEYVMSFMVNMSDPGLQVFPTHRVVHDVAGFDLAAFKAKIAAAPGFTIEAVPGLDARDGLKLRAYLAQAGLHMPSFLLLAPSDAQAHLVQFAGDVTHAGFDVHTPREVRELDVAILHELILDHMLGIDRAAQEAKTNLRYMKKLDEALAAADDPANQAVFLMNPTPVAQVHAVCRSGGKMPQKSTFFYPKILTGLVINPL
jgi:uncharacterized protein (DUF1015 family)